MIYLKYSSMIHTTISHSLLYLARYVYFMTTSVHSHLTFDKITTTGVCVIKSTIINDVDATVAVVRYVIVSGPMTIYVVVLMIEFIGRGRTMNDVISNHTKPAIRFGYF